MHFKTWIRHFLFAPDDLSGGGTSTAPVTGTPPDQTQPQPSVSGADTLPGAGAPDATQTQPDQTTPDPLLEHLRGQGYGDMLANYKNGQEFVQDLLGERQRLAQQMSQYQQFAQYGQQLLPYYSQFQEFLKQQQTQQAQQPKEKPWHSQFWNPPEYDRSLDRFIKTDAQGNPLPGTPLEIYQKRQQYEAYLQQQAEKFWQNPIQFLEEPVKHLAQQVAENIVKQHLGNHSEVSFAKDYTEKNASWLYQMDQSGQPLYTQVIHPQTGRQVMQRVLSPAGQAFQRYVAEAEQMGIRDVHAQQQYAEKLLRAEIIYASQNKGQTAAPGAVPSSNGAAPPVQPGASGAPVQTPDQIKKNFVQSQASTGAGFAGNPPPAPPPPANGFAPPRSFMELARENAAKFGMSLDPES